MKLTPDRTDAISAAIREIGRRVQDATLATNTDDARKALDDVWHATRIAQQFINDAEQATRREALAKLGEVA